MFCEIWQIKEFEIAKIDGFKIASIYQRAYQRGGGVIIYTSLKSIITENNVRQLRNRQFRREPRWKNDSISYRLATLANKEIKEIEIAKTRNGLKNKFKNKCFLIDYNTQCRIRNCFICSQH